MFIEIVLDRASGSQAAGGVFPGTLAELEEKRPASTGLSGWFGRDYRKAQAGNVTRLLAKETIEDRRFAITVTTVHGNTTFGALTFGVSGDKVSLRMYLRCGRRSNDC